MYPEFKQLDTTVEGGGLKEADAWPAQVCERHSEEAVKAAVRPKYAVWRMLSCVAKCCVALHAYAAARCLRP